MPITPRSFSKQCVCFLPVGNATQAANAAQAPTGSSRRHPRTTSLPRRLRRRCHSALDKRTNEMLLALVVTPRSATACLPGFFFQKLDPAGAWMQP